jgi:microcystin degradation protein MlrC
MRVALLQLFHEANGFSPIPIGLRDFRTRHWCEGKEVRRRFGATRNWLGGAIAACDAAGVDLEIGLCTSCHPGGVVAADAFAVIRAAMLSSLRAICAKGQPDVVLLLLHGALLVEDCLMPEGELVAAVRSAVGGDVVIGVTLDFHGNIDPLLARTADLLIGGKLYPHTDAFNRGHRLAELAFASVRDPHETRHVLLPIATPLPRQETMSSDSPFGELVQLSEALAARFGLDDLNLMGGFHFSDRDWASMSVFVTGGARPDQDAAIRAMADAVWAGREALLAPLPDLAAAAQLVAARPRNGMTLVVDTGDNPGGGGTGETASLLPWLVAESVDFAAGFFVDPALARRAAEAGPGGRFSATIGAATDLPFITEAIVEWSGEISYRNTGPMMTGELLEGGPGAVLRIGAGRIIVTTERIQAYDINAFLSLGIDLTPRDVVLIKSSAHFRASYAPLAAGGIILCDGGGWSSSDLSRFAYEGRMRSILPLADLDKAAWSLRIEEELIRSS